MPRSCWVCSKIDNTIIAIATHILLISLLRVFRWARASKAKRRNTTANNDNNNHSNNDNNNNSYRSKGDAEEMSTLTASSMPGLPGRGNGVRVPDQDQRPASVPPVLKRPGRKRRPMSRVSLETLKNFGNLLRDGGLPKPVETTEDPRGNQMSITSTGHIHHPKNFTRSSATREATSGAQPAMASDGAAPPSSLPGSQIMCQEQCVVVVVVGVVGVPVRKNHI